VASVPPPPTVRSVPPLAAKPRIMHSVAPLVLPKIWKSDSSLSGALNLTYPWNCRRPLEYSFCSRISERLERLSMILKVSVSVLLS